MWLQKKEEQDKNIHLITPHKISIIRSKIHGDVLRMPDLYAQLQDVVGFIYGLITW